MRRLPKILANVVLVIAAMAMFISSLISSDGLFSYTAGLGMRLSWRFGVLALCVASIVTINKVPQKMRLESKTSKARLIILSFLADMAFMALSVFLLLAFVYIRYKLIRA